MIFVPLFKVTSRFYLTLKKKEGQMTFFLF